MVPKRALSHGVLNNMFGLSITAPRQLMLQLDIYYGKSIARTTRRTFALAKHGT